MVTHSCGEVKRLAAGLPFEGFPAVGPPPGDLAGGHQGPERHGRGFRACAGLHRVLMRRLNSSCRRQRPRPPIFGLVPSVDLEACMKVNEHRWERVSWPSWVACGSTYVWAGFGLPKNIRITLSRPIRRANSRKEAEAKNRTRNRIPMNPRGQTTSSGRCRCATPATDWVRNLSASREFGTKGPRAIQPATGWFDRLRSHPGRDRTFRPARATYS